MSEPLHFSRLTLRRDAADIAPLLQVLQPSKSSDRLAVDHQLLWTVIPTEIRTEVEQSRAAGTPKSRVSLAGRPPARAVLPSRSQAFGRLALLHYRDKTL